MWGSSNIQFLVIKILPWKRQKETCGEKETRLNVKKFQNIFLRLVERDQWHEMGLKLIIFLVPFAN